MFRNSKKVWGDTTRRNHFWALMPNKGLAVIFALVAALGIYVAFFSDYSKVVEVSTYQSPNPIVDQEVANDVRQIDWEIDSRKNYTSKTLSQDEFLGYPTDGGGDLTGYFVDNELRRIVVKVGLSYEIITEVYYFNKSEIIFVHAGVENYFTSNDGSPDYTQTKPVYSGAFTFQKGKLVSHTYWGEEKYTNDESAEREFIDSAQKYYKLLTR